LAEQVATGKLDPYSAADDLLAGWPDPGRRRSARGGRLAARGIRCRYRNIKMPRLW